MRLGAEVDLKTHELKHVDPVLKLPKNITFHQLLTLNDLIQLKYKKRVLLNNYLIFAVNEDQQCANFELIANRFVKNQFKIDLSYLYNGLELKMCTHKDDTIGNEDKPAGEKKSKKQKKDYVCSSKFVAIHKHKKR